VKIKIFIIILAIYLAPLSSFSEDSGAQNLEIYEGKWIINCTSGSNEEEKKCALERSVYIDKEMKRKLITIIIQTESLSTGVRFVLVSPLGTLISSGVKIGFDGKFVSEKAYSFNVCRQVGCITTMMVKKETLESFKKADNLNLKYVGANGKKIEIDFGLDGFVKEFKKISKI